MNDKGNSVSPVSQRIVIDGCTVILRYAASSDPAAAHAVQNSLFTFKVRRSRFFAITAKV